MLDAGTNTDNDRTAVAAVPGGAKAIREHVAALERFYGGVIDEHAATKAPTSPGDTPAQG